MSSPTAAMPWSVVPNCRAVKRISEASSDPFQDEVISSCESFPLLIEHRDILSPPAALPGIPGLTMM